MDSADLLGQVALFATGAGVAGAGPGLAAGIYQNGGLVAQAFSGSAVIEHEIPVGAGTAFDIASASKQFTAACLVLLQRDGALSLDDDVRAHLPELLLPVPVTLRQCLSHTSGLREYYSLCELAGVPVAAMDEARLLRLLAGQTELNFPPGTSWSYSNSGFVLAAAALRRITGRSLAEFASERLFRPLGMGLTHFRDDLGVPVSGLATGYTPAPGGGWRRVDMTEETVGDGGLVTSVSDLAGWQQFMLTGAVLGREVRDALLEPAVLADGRRLPYALGLELATVGGRPVYLHSGAIDGFRSALAYLIENGAGIAVLANRDDIFPAQIALRIAEQLVGGAGPAAAPVPLGERAALAAQPAVAGLWFSSELDTHLALDPARDGTVSRLEGGRRYRYAAMSDGSWLGLQGACSTRLCVTGDELRCEETTGDEPPEIYARVRETPAAVPPAGTYRSEELIAYATLAPAGHDAAGAAGTAGAAEITVGLTGPRIVAPGAGGAWAGEGLTLRVLADGEALEISLPGARRCRFTRVDRPAPPRQRGL